MTSEPNATEAQALPSNRPARNIARVKLVGALLTLAGIALFVYFVASVGISEILEIIGRFGFVGFAVILSIFFLRIALRSAAWCLSVYEPFELKLRDAVPAVIIGEAMSTMVPLGILVSGTAKAVAVRRSVPLVVGLSSVATENLFYSVTTSLFLILGAFTFLRTFDLDPGWALTIDLMIGLILLIVLLLFAMVIRQWHFASEACEWLYRRGVLAGILEKGRMQVRLFENLIYGFYRRYPGRFFPICIIEMAFHALGVLEVWFILARISEAGGTALNAFLLESVSRLVTIVFKLVPFLIGVDEAGAQFVAETVGIGAAVGVTLAIIRKGRLFFWAMFGVVLILKRGLSFRGIFRAKAD